MIEFPAGRIVVTEITTATVPGFLEAVDGVLTVGDEVRPLLVRGGGGHSTGHHYHLYRRHSGGRRESIAFVQRSQPAVTESFAKFRFRDNYSERAESSRKFCKVSFP